MIGTMARVKSWIAKLVNLYDQADVRNHVRIPAEFEASLNGPFGTVFVTGVDATRDGAGVQSMEPLAIGTLVFLKISTLGLMGFAHVRHCSKRGDGYLLGLKFREPLMRDRDYIEADWSRQRVRREAIRVWDEADAS
jgi:hypothetical protein